MSIRALANMRMVARLTEEEKEAYQLITTWPWINEDENTDVLRVPPAIFEAISLHGKLLHLVPVFWRLPELCLQAVRSCPGALRSVPELVLSIEMVMSAVMRQGSLLSSVKDPFRTPDVIAAGLRSCPWMYAALRPKEKTYPTAFIAVSTDAIQLKDVDKTLWDDALVVTALVQDGSLIRLLDNLTEPWIHAAARQNPAYVMQFGIEKKYRTEALVMIALERDGMLLPDPDWAPFSDEQWERFYDQALTTTPAALRLLPPGKQTRDRVAKAVTVHGALLQWANPAWVDHDLCRMACANDARALPHVPPDFLSFDVYMAACLRDRSVLTAVPVEWQEVIRSICDEV